MKQLFLVCVASAVASIVATLSSAVPRRQQTFQATKVEHAYHASFPAHSLSIREPTLCDPSVQQYAGYLNVTDDRHLFFWFFESRSSPSTDPLILWLNGGLGSSSSMALLWELGPCWVTENGTSTKYNEFSWNSNANLVFLDQPANTGYSYSTKYNTTAPVSTSPDAALDVYAFLELFLKKFPKYRNSDFHIAGESYAGTYIPNIASVIYHKNKELEAPSLTQDCKNDVIMINLKSILIGNGLTDPIRQFSSTFPYSCHSELAVFEPDADKCQMLEKRTPTCAKLVQECYEDDDPAVCGPAAFYCFVGLGGIVRRANRNIYDSRRFCNNTAESNDSDCYVEGSWQTAYLNTPSVKVELGVPAWRVFKGSNGQVNEAFLFNGDGVRNTAGLLPGLVDGGVRLLAYAGDRDLTANWMGVAQWVQDLPSKFHEEYSKSPVLPWKSMVNGTLKQTGTVRSAGGNGMTAGNVTFVRIFEAGHMSPFDQPEATLDMLNRWILNEPMEAACL